MNYSMEPKTIIVLGCHRSATSLVAKGLSQVIQMGPNGRQFDDQPDGNWENLDFVLLSDTILKAAGGTWDAPPTEKAILEISKELKATARNLVEGYNMRWDFWGWKDPRTCLTYPVFKPFIRNPIFVYVYRDPQKVAESLQRRNGFSIAKGIRLAKIYNDRAMDIIEGQ